MNKASRTILITLAAFGVYFLLDESFFSSLRGWLNHSIDLWGISHIITYIIIGLPIIIGTWLIHKDGRVYKYLGLDGGIIQAFIFGLLCTSPMFIGYALSYDFNYDFSLNRFLMAVLAAAFFEEFYFRGFLFGQLYRYTNWGFIPAVIIGAILFGAVHLYQGKEMSELLDIFLITFMGAVLYAWAYVEWNYNLWVPIFLHLLMNLSWELFSAGENALGGAASNLFRGATIALIIILTLAYKRRRAEKPAVNRNTIWMKRNQAGA